MTSKAAGAANRAVSARPTAPDDRYAAEPIDIAYLSRFTAGDRALEREVLELFAGQVPIYLRALHAAQTASAWHQAAHTIKGSAAAIGAWRLAQFAEKAESLDLEADAATLKGHRAQVMSALAAATDEVCRYIERLFPRL